MKVLVACEYSGRVRDAFIAHGHDAMSCDLLETEVKLKSLVRITKALSKTFFTKAGILWSRIRLART